MFKSIGLFILVLVAKAVNGELFGVGDCVCTTDITFVKNAGVNLTLGQGECGTLTGANFTLDGNVWHEMILDTKIVLAFLGIAFVKQEPVKCSGRARAILPAPSSCPKIISRSEWGARAPKGVSHLTNPVHYMFIHHAESNECLTEASCASEVRGFQHFHMDTRGWNDIGYSFLVGGDGSVFEGRGWDVVGAHTQGYNSVGYAICFIGNFMHKSPTDVQIQMAKQLIDCAVERGKLSSSYVLRGHRDVNDTDCPGDVLYALIKHWAHY